MSRQEKESRPLEAQDPQRLVVSRMLMAATFLPMAAAWSVVRAEVRPGLFLQPGGDLARDVVLSTRHEQRRQSGVVPAKGNQPAQLAGWHDDVILSSQGHDFPGQKRDVVRPVLQTLYQPIDVLAREPLGTGKIAALGDGQHRTGPVGRQTQKIPLRARIGLEADAHGTGTGLDLDMVGQRFLAGAEKHQGRRSIESVVLILANLRAISRQF